MDLALFAPVVALFGSLILIRLSYLDGQFDKLLSEFQQSHESIDKKFQQELRKRTPKKDVVLSYATQMIAKSTVCNNIKGYSAKNRLHIGFDLAAIMIFIGIFAMDGSNDIQAEMTIDILQLVLVVSATMSIMTFIEKYGQFHRLKNKAMSIKD